jgi:Putative metal-binding motif
MAPASRFPVTARRGIASPCYAVGDSARPPGQNAHMKRWLWIGTALGACALSSHSAQARLANAQFTDCGGCHGETPGAAISVALDPPAPSPGELVRMTITVTGPGIQIGGFSVFDDDATGLFTVPPGQAVALDNPQWAFHSRAQPVRGGSVQYQVDWQAPDMPGAVNFLVSAVAGNGNGQNSGDYFTQRNVQFSFGCTAIPYYFDGDGDGAGDASFGTKIGCRAPLGYAALDDDCDGNDDNVHPGAPERCNGKDDDCDGEVDEGLELLPRYPDKDRDGFGSATGEPVLGCTAASGFVDSGDDCDDGDATRHPGVVEVCDFIDNDCNGKVDDGAREICGVGLCQRESASCFAACVPGSPLREVCDGFDDDCDGETDEADACPEGRVCLGFDCVDAALAAAPDSNADAGSSDGPSSESSAGSVSAPRMPSLEPAKAEAPQRSGCQLSTRGGASAWMLALGCAMALRRRGRLCRWSPGAAAENTRWGGYSR